VVNGLALILGTIWLFAPVLVAAHCQVPCGIYNDEARVERLREDAQTIAKAIEQMTELAGKSGRSVPKSDDALGDEQRAAWVTRH
jgi:nickel superoxide dismutase